MGVRRKEGITYRPYVTGLNHKANARRAYRQTVRVVGLPCPAVLGLLSWGCGLQGPTVRVVGLPRTADPNPNHQGRRAALPCWAGAAGLGLRPAGSNRQGRRATLPCWAGLRPAGPNPNRQGRRAALPCWAGVAACRSQPQPSGSSGCPALLGWGCRAGAAACRVQPSGSSGCPALLGWGCGLQVPTPTVRVVGLPCLAGLGLWPAGPNPNRQGRWAALPCWARAAGLGLCPILLGWGCVHGTAGGRGVDLPMSVVLLGGWGWICLRLWCSWGLGVDLPTSMVLLGSWGFTYVCGAPGGPGLDLPASVALLWAGD